MAPWMLALKLTELNPGGCTKQMSNKAVQAKKAHPKRSVLYRDHRSEMHKIHKHNNTPRCIRLDG
jgi:hypothetical protein